MCGRLRVGKDFFHFASRAVQPCVRPVSAGHATAGHNALHGSGSGQQPAFDNALAQVGGAGLCRPGMAAAFGKRQDSPAFRLPADDHLTTGNSANSGH
jgi:hypothetical protein